MSGSRLSRIATGVALTLVLIGFLLALTGFQLTSRTTGERILRRAVATSTDLQGTIPRIETELHKAADQETSESVVVPDFPIRVELSRSEATTPAGDKLYERILDESARRLYDEGTPAWTSNEPTMSQDIRRISAPGAFDTAFGMITSSSHTWFLIAMIVLGVLGLLLAAVLLTGLRWDVRFLVLGLVALAAAVPSLAAAAVFALALRIAEPASDPFVSALLDLGIDAAWVGVRDYLAVTVVGLAITGIAALGLGAESRRTGERETVAG